MNATQNPLTAKIRTTKSYYDVRMGFLPGEEKGNLILQKNGEEQLYILKNVRFEQKELVAEYVQFEGATMSAIGLIDIPIPTTVVEGRLRTGEVREVRDVFLIHNLTKDYHDIQIDDESWWEGVYKRVE